MKPCPPHPGLGGLGLDFSSFLPSGLRQAPLSTTVYMLEKSSLREPPWLLAQRQPDSSVRSSEGRAEALGLGWGGSRVKGPKLHCSASGFHPVKLSQRTATIPFCRETAEVPGAPSLVAASPGTGSPKPRVRSGFSPAGSGGGAPPRATRSMGVTGERGRLCVAPGLGRQARVSLTTPRPPGAVGVGAATSQPTPALPP